MLTNVMIWLLALSLVVGVGILYAQTARAGKLLPNVEPEMLNPDYWIGKHPNPHQVILTLEQIKALNNRIAANDKTVLQPEKVRRTYDRRVVQSTLEQDIAKLSQQKMQFKNASLVRPEFWDKVRQNMNLAKLPATIEARYAVLVKFTDNRVLPLEEGIYDAGDDGAFDRLQNTAFEIGTPHIVLHSSLDGKWLYALGPDYRGWYPKDAMAFCTFPEWKDYAQAQNFIVITSAKADIFTAEESKRTRGFIRLGNTLPFKESRATGYVVMLPTRAADGRLEVSDAFVPYSSAHEGFMSYTPANAIRMAFKVLGTDYGWGDLNSDWDCSSFVKSVYAIFGIRLPRDGGNQARAGSLNTSLKGIPSSARDQEIVSKAIPGISLLRMPGHIMIYVGEHKGRAYVIHSVYAYRRKNKSGVEESVVIGKNSVSDLHLGAESKRGSWLARLESIIDVK